MGHNDDGFETHSYIVESSSVRFKGEILFGGVVGPDGRSEFGVGGDVFPVHHFGGLGIGGASVVSAGESGQVVAYGGHRGVGGVGVRGGLLRFLLLFFSAQLLVELVVALQVSLLERLHGSSVQRVRVGDAVVEEVARHGDEDARGDEEDVRVRRGVGVGSAGAGRSGLAGLLLAGGVVIDFHFAHAIGQMNIREAV